MRTLPVPLILIAFCIALVACETHRINSWLRPDYGSADDETSLDKRLERYAFGLGRRSYTYTSGPGIKRLPVYNFGLGKRARPYSFGLGKRSELDDNYSDLSDNYDSGNFYENNKQQLPYNFGIGKRAKREGPPYSFGLGKR